MDKRNIALNGNFDPKQYDFIDAGLMGEISENYEDIVEDKLFKWRYRQNEDSHEKYINRMQRVRTRFYERATRRDPILEQNLADTFIEDQKHTNVGTFFTDTAEFRAHAQEQTEAHREYMAREGVQQFRDYYEDEASEQGFFEYLDNLPNRDRIRFMECAQDFTRNDFEVKATHMISKREFNPELSAFSNLILDLVDFRDRVRPIAKDISMLDATLRYQSRPLKEVVEEEKAF